MSQTLFRCLIAAALVAGVLPRSSDAAPQIATFQFNGTVAGVFDSTYQSTPNPYSGVVAPGDAWSATLIVDLNSPPTPSSGLGNYADAIVAGSLTFANGLSFNLGGSDYIHIETPHVTMAYQAFNEVNGHRPHLVDFNLYNWTNPAPMNLHEVASRFSLSNIQNPQVTVFADSGPSHHIQLNVLSALVPEPSAAALSFLVLLSLGPIRLSRQRG
jgi:hypothetical protein